MVKTIQLPLSGSDVFGFTPRNWNTILKIFETFSSIKEVILFGSRAAGTHRPYSDVDLCIMNSDFDRQQYVRVIAAFEESDLPYFTDVLVYHQLQNDAMKENILTRGKSIYSKAL